MEALDRILEKKSTELELPSKKLEEVCCNCGEKLYRQYFIFGKNRTVKVNCKCERDAIKAKEIEQENKDRQIRLERIIKNSLMDKKFFNDTFENWDFSRGSKKLYSLGKKYCLNFKKAKENSVGLLIYGEPGNGKTYLSNSIANELLKEYIPTISVNIDSLLDRIKQTYSKWGNEAEADIIRGLQNADLLIIDDLGTEQYTDWSRSTIYNIIDGRNRQGLPLIITTNLPVQPNKINGILADIYGRRTEDRIFEMCIPVENTGKSIRVEKAKEKTKILKELLEV